MLRLFARIPGAMRGINHVTDRRRLHRWRGPTIVTCQRQFQFSAYELRSQAQLFSKSQHRAEPHLAIGRWSHAWALNFFHAVTVMPSLRYTFHGLQLDASGRSQDTSAHLGDERQLHVWEIAPIYPSSELATGAGRMSVPLHEGADAVSCAFLYKT